MAKVAAARGVLMRDAGHLSQRRFIGLSTFATVSVALGVPGEAPAEDAGLRETADLITGPFYPQRKPPDSDVDMTLIRGHRSRASGPVVQLSGRVLNLRGEPLRDVRIEVWQANANGRYTHPSDPNTNAPFDPDFQGYAALRTDRDGRYFITTIKPGPYPTARGDMRAPHMSLRRVDPCDRRPGLTRRWYEGRGPDRMLVSRTR